MSSQDYNSYNSRVEMTARFRTSLLAKFDFKMILDEQNTSSFVFEAIVYCVKWCHGIYDQWLSPQILAWMISLGKHSSRRFTLRARNSLWSPKTVYFSPKSNVLVNQKLKPRPEVFFQFCHLANVIGCSIDVLRPRRDWTLPVWNERSYPSSTPFHMYFTRTKIFHPGWR